MGKKIARYDGGGQERRFSDLFNTVPLSCTGPFIPLSVDPSEIRELNWTTHPQLPAVLTEWSTLRGAGDGWSSGPIRN